MSASASSQLASAFVFSPSAPSVRHIILIGFMGSGKTTVSRLLARRLNLPCVDTDDLVQQRTGLSIPTIFDKRGEDYFRRQEHVCLCEQAVSEPSVLSCGGGIILSAENRALLVQMGPVIYLTVSPQQALRRISHPQNRPVLRSALEQTDSSPAALERAVATLLAQREGFYAALATYTVDTDHRDQDGVVDEICAVLAQGELS
ncbi:MAG: shikimate kinase [Coriobacteriales bacterium]|nr:shikimate kinase [Coriobacteriales bacterium]